MGSDNLRDTHSSPMLDHWMQNCMKLRGVKGSLGFSKKGLLLVLASCSGRKGVDVVGHEGHANIVEGRRNRFSLRLPQYIARAEAISHLQLGVHGLLSEDVKRCDDHGRGGWEQSHSDPLGGRLDREARRRQDCLRRSTCSCQCSIVEC